MTENQIRPLDLVELKNVRIRGLKLKLSQTEDYIMGNPAEDEFIMFRTQYANQFGIDLQFFQHSNSEYTPLGVQTLLYYITYKIKDANLLMGVEDSENGHHITIKAPPNVDIIHDKNY